MTTDIIDLFIPPTPEENLASLLSIASTVGLDTTSWQPGQPERTIFAIIAQLSSDQGQIVSTLAQAGFLDWAAKVTPEGGPGWLDILALAVYRVTRRPATAASTTETIVASGAAGGTFAAGTLHFTTAIGAVYTNTAPVTIPTSGTVAVAISADVAGSASSAGIGAINALLTPMIGVTVTNATSAVGADAEANDALVARCRNRLAALSVEGPSGAYDYAARTINDENEVHVVSGSLEQPVEPVTRTRVLASPTTGVVTTYVANANGGYETPPNYTEQVAKNIKSSTNASPIVVELTGHGYVTNDQIFISDHLANTNANGSWIITFVDANHFSLNGSSGNGVGSTTGTAYRYSDLDLIDKSIEANAVPLSVTHQTLSAAELGWSITGIITVTGAAATLTDPQIIALANTALAKLVATVPIGGQGDSGLLYLETIRTTIYQAVGASNVVLSVPSADVAIGANEVLVAPTTSFTVTRI